MSLFRPDEQYLVTGSQLDELVRLVEERSDSWWLHRSDHGIKCPPYDCKGGEPGHGYSENWFKGIRALSALEVVLVAQSVGEQPSGLAPSEAPSLPS